MAEEKGSYKDEGDKRERDQGKLSVEVKKKDDDSDQQKDVLKKVDENRSEHFMNILNIVGQSCD